MSGILPRSGLSIKQPHLSRNRKSHYMISERDRRDKLDGGGFEVRSQKFKVFGTSNPEPRTSDRAVLASHAAGSMAVVDSFSILLGRETTITEGGTPNAQASLAVKMVKLPRSRPTVTQDAI